MELKLKPIVIAASVSATMLFGQAVVAADKVVISEFKYASAQGSLYVLKEIIETKLGLEVESLPGTNAVFYAGMDRGNGEVDLHAEGWMPNQIALVKEYVEEKGTVAMSQKSYAATSGFCVPRYFSEEYNVKTISDLARPEIAKLLDSDGDGMGEIWSGNPAWIATKENSVKIRDYGLELFNVNVQSDGAVYYANLAAAVKKKAGIAGYCWSPDGVWKQYDVVQLEEPAFADSCYNFVNPQSDEKWYENSKITCGSAPKGVHILWSKNLETRLPILTAFLANVELDSETVSGWAYEIGSLKRDAKEVAHEWIAANEDRVNKWLGL